MKKIAKFAVLIMLCIGVLLTIAACGEGGKDQETLEAAMETISVRSSVNTATLALPTLSGYDDVKMTITSSDTNLIANDGTVKCGGSGTVTINVALELNAAKLDKDFTVAVNYPHNNTKKFDNDDHWDECSRCSAVSNKTAHTLTAVNQAKGEWTDGLSGNVCSGCSYNSTTPDYVTGFSFADANAVISSISRASELTLTTKSDNPESMIMTLHLQAQKAVTKETDATLIFMSPRDSEKIRKDTLKTVKLVPGQKTFTFEVDLSDFFIPLAEDSYELDVELDGAMHIVTTSTGSTFTPLQGQRSPVGYLYTITPKSDAPNIPRVSRVADATATKWNAADFSLEEKGGKPVLTLSGRISINGTNSNNTTIPRTISIWFINENQAVVGKKNALTTENKSTSADTRDFKFEIDLSDLPANSDWYKLTIGVDEGNGELGLTHTSGEGTISTNGTERNFCGDTSNTIKTISVGGKTFKVVTAYSQVHLRVG